MINNSVTKSDYKVEFVNNILDNVHGLIGLTKVENKIESLQVFKRLQGISQLGFVSKIFPGALHTRYLHSLGVMYVVDKLAKKLLLTEDERQILRLAALLHDIGHYPLSHDLELAYKKSNKLNLISRNKFDAKETIDKLSEVSDKYDFALNGHKTDKFHHESIGAIVIKSSSEIFDAIKELYVKDNSFYDGKGLNEDEITDSLIHDICGIIIGDVTEHESLYFKDIYTLMVQLMHSEMDADNLDYLLRDATFSGTTYGSMDMSLLISHLCRQEVEFLLQNIEDGTYKKVKHWIVGVNNKGIGSAEQFMLSKYLAYSQVIHHKYTAIFGAMLRHLIIWTLKENQDEFKKSDIQSLARQCEESEFLHYTDRYILNYITDLDTDSINCSEITKKIINNLKSNKALNFDEDFSEIVFTAKSKKELANLVYQTNYYKLIVELYDKINLNNGNLGSVNEELLIESFLFQTEYKKITNQIPLSEFNKMLNRLKVKNSRRDRDSYYLDRLLNGIAIIGNEKEKPILIVDSKASMISSIYGLQYLKLRKYSIV